MAPRKGKTMEVQFIAEESTAAGKTLAARSRAAEKITKLIGKNKASTRRKTAPADPKEVHKHLNPDQAATGEDKEQKKGVPSARKQKVHKNVDPEQTASEEDEDEDEKQGAPPGKKQKAHEYVDPEQTASGEGEDEDEEEDEDEKHVAPFPKSRFVLTHKNLFETAVMYCRYNLTDQPRSSLPGTLLQMLQSGEYIPSASWVLSKNQGKADFTRLEALWKCMVNPETLQMDDVTQIFFESMNRDIPTS